MSVVDFPLNRAEAGSAGFDFQRLAMVLSESSELLQAARDSSDEDFKEASMELAVRALKAACLAIQRHSPAMPAGAPSRVLRGPWAAPAAELP